MRRGSPGSPGSDHGGGSAEEARRDFLAELTGWLWPGHVFVDAEQSGAGALRTYAAVPTRSRPTVLVPMKPRSVAASVLRGYKPSAGLRTRAMLTVASVGARVGALDVFPHRLELRRASGSLTEDIEQHLSGVFGRPVVVAPYTSPPRANRKPVLHVLTEQGRTLGFAKVAWNELTDRLVLAEAAALKRLGRAELATVGVPELIHLGEFRDHPVLVQSAVRGSPWQRPSWTRVVAAMKEVASVSGLYDDDLAGSQFVVALGARLQDLRHHPSGEGLITSFDRVLDAAGDQRVIFGSWHGDWTPWNMAVKNRGVALWDWERFQEGVPLGFDALHYTLQRELVPRRQDPGVAAQGLLRDAASTLSPLGIDEASAPLLAMLYLIEVGARLVGDRQDEVGGRRGHIDRWLLPVIVDGAAELRRSRTAG